jgi:hypothetical protein
VFESENLLVVEIGRNLAWYFISISACSVPKVDPSTSQEKHQEPRRSREDLVVVEIDLI